MANSTSANLKLTVQATGENSGTWGQITNTNLLILEQAIGGFTTFNLTNANRSLTFTNGALSDGKNDVIKLTGTLAANRTVSIPDSIEKVYHVQNACDHAGNTLTFKTSSGTGVLLCEGNNYVLYSDGTNIVKLSEQRNWRAVSAAETVQAGAQLLVNTNGGAVTITLPASPSTGDEVSFMDQGYDFNTNALTVGRNGSNIANAASDLVVNTQGAGFSLVYSGDATTGWSYREKQNMSNYEATKYDFDGANLTGIEGVNTGIIVPWSSASIPSGFLECDGSNVSRTTYSALFAVVGTTYGAGDGSSTFGLPDLQNNVCVGKSNNKALASTGGAETVTSTGNVGGSTANASLSTAQLASHSHPGGANTPHHNGDNNPTASGMRRVTLANTGSSGSGQGHSHNMSANFSGDATSVLQPYLTTLYIIKTQEKLWQLMQHGQL